MNCNQYPRVSCIICAFISLNVFLIQGVFSFESEYWGNNQTYNAHGGIQDNFEETKLASYSNTPFTHICLGMTVDIGSDSSNTKWIGIHYEAISLYSLIADGLFKPLNVGASKWQSLIEGSLIPAECPFEGFNVHKDGDPTQKRVRIGYLGHKRCRQDEGLIGFGTDLNDFRWSSGYIYPSRQGNGAKQISAFGYIYVR